MARTRLKVKGRRESGSFAAIPHAILDSPEYAGLSAHAVKALLDLFAQYRGENNGDLTAAWSLMQIRGWTSKALLYRALRELLDKGWIVKTRQGGRHQASLYGVTWKPINPCGGKLDVSPTHVAPGTWKHQRGNQNSGPPVKLCGPTVVPITRRSGVN